MSSAKVVSPSEWRTARLELLAKEKELTRAQDALTKQRQSLPIVEITKPYKFTATNCDSGEETTVSLAELFDHRRQLVMYHFMFDPEWDEGCSHCSFMGDSIPTLEHLHYRDISLVFVSRAPIDKIDKYKKRMGWTFPWVSSFQSDFNYDFHVTNDADTEKYPVEQNFRTAKEMDERDITWGPGEMPGISCFVLGGQDGVGEEGKVYHTYSAYARGVERVVPSVAWMDLAYFGRQDEKYTGVPRRDEYTAEDLKGSA